MRDDAICRWCRKRYDQHVDSYGPTDPVPRMPCTGLKTYFYERTNVTKPTPEAEAFKLDDSARARAHKRLDRWIQQCEHDAADAYEDGRSGYLGRMKLCAFVDDEGVHLRVESSQSEGV